jgi:hypothetical protein
MIEVHKIGIKFWKVFKAYAIAQKKKFCENVIVHSPGIPLKELNFLKS